MSAAGTTPGQALGNMTANQASWAGTTTTSNCGCNNTLYIKRWPEISQEKKVADTQAVGFEIIYRLDVAERVQTRVVIGATEEQAKKAVRDSFLPCDLESGEALEIIAAVPVVVSL